MAFDFTKLLSPEKQEEYRQLKAYADEQRVRARSMDNDTLANTIEYFMTQSQIPRGHWAPSDPVYDAQLFFILLPEMVRRLRRNDD